MELRDIEYFALVAEYRHLGRAAEALELSTSALSKSLRRLEVALQAKLVRRTPKGVELTPEGAALYAQVQKFRVFLSDIAREITELGQGRVGHLRIGTFAGTGESLLAPAIAELLRVAPNVNISVILGNTYAVVPALRRGELDLIVGTMPDTPYDDVVQEHLYDDEFVACVSANHRLAKCKRLSLADVVRERWIISPAGTLLWRRLHRAFEDQGLPAPVIAMDTASAALQVRTVASTDFLGCLSQRLLREVRPAFHLVALPLREILYRRRTAVGYRKNGYLSPLARRFVDSLKKGGNEKGRAR